MPPEDDAIAWRCVRTKPKSEHIAARHINLLEAVDVYCPRIRYPKTTRRGRVWFVEALFPGYLFCRFDLWESLRAINAAPGVTGVVQFGGRYSALPEGAIDSLRAEFAAEEPVVVEQILLPGDSVEIVEGPLRGQSGVITWLPPGRDRVRVLLEFLGQEREVEVPLEVLLGRRTAREVASGQEDHRP